MIRISTNNIRIKYFKSIEKLIIVCVSLLLTNCAVHKVRFDCKAGHGIGCEPLSRVNELVNNNEIDQIIDENNKSYKQKRNICRSCKNNNITSDSNPFSSNISYQTKNIKAPYRTNEEIIRIWFNNYLDSNGNYIGEQYIYAVIEPSKWVR